MASTNFLVFAQTAFFRWHAFNLTGGGDPVRLVGAEVSSSLSTAEVNADKGRIFLPEEEIAGKNKLVLLSHHLWSSRFAADSTVLGRSISLDGQFFTVIGVMPTGFTFPNKADFSVPVSLSADASNASLQFLARVKPEYPWRARAMRRQLSFTSSNKSVIDRSVRACASRLLP